MSADISGFIAQVPVPGSGIIASIVSFLGGLVKGKTPHASYDQVITPAQQWAVQASASFADFNSDEKLLIQRAVVPRFLNAMQQNWGLGASLNNSIARDIQSSNSDITRLLTLLFVWVGTNVDSSQAATFNTYMATLYPGIFVNAVNDMGLDVHRISGVPGSTVNPPPGQSGSMGASLGMSPVMLIIILVVVIFLVARKGRA